jgi:hypothetical protein
MIWDDEESMCKRVNPFVWAYSPLAYLVDEEKGCQKILN